MSSWGKKSIGGTFYDLTHLDPITFDVTPKAPSAPTYSVRVSFGLHTFTKSVEPTDSVAHYVRHAGETRCFCPTRYQHSLSLPAIVNAAATGRAYFSNGKSFLLVENIAGVNAPYVVFFNIEKSKLKQNDAAMFVVSAYAKPQLPKKLPAITFATLVSHTVLGKTITRPKK